MSHSRQPFHPGTLRMLAAATRLAARVDPLDVAGFEGLIPRLFTARAARGALLLDTCGREVQRLLEPEPTGADLLLRFPRSDRAALRLLLQHAGHASSAVVARIAARGRSGPLELELTLAPLLRRTDGSEALLGLLQPVRAHSLERSSGRLRVLALHPAPGPRPRPRLAAPTAR